MLRERVREVGWLVVGTYYSNRLVLLFFAFIS
jgi:hypothetical protein